MKELDDLVDKTLLDASKELTPRLREAIRDALNKGASADDIRNRWGIASNSTLTACAVEAIVAEWQRERAEALAAVAPDLLTDLVACRRLLGELYAKRRSKSPIPAVLAALALADLDIAKATPKA